MSCKQSRHERRRQILFLFRAATFFLVYITTTPTDSIAAEASWRTSAAPCERIVFQTGFEQNNLAVDISDFKLVDGVALEGRRSLMGQVTEANQACFLPIPYTAREKRQVNVSFFMRTDNRLACAVFWRKDNARTKTSWTRVPNVSAAKWTHVTCSHAFDGDISPSELWARLDGVEFVCIPHQLADWKQKGRSNPPTDWTYHHEHHQPVAEIFQGRGSYEYLGCPRQAALGAPFRGNYLQDAWAKGIVIGTIASPDHGGGKGKAGVWAEEFTRQSIIQAIRARHTFGTSGAKMTMRLAASWNGRSAMMGDKVARPKGPIRFTVEGSALRDIREVVIFRNNEPVCAKETGDKEFTLNWTDPAPPDEKLLWYYARFQATDEELAWSSPIWFVK